ncbi:hypothetical protein TS65_25420 [Aneurinibacillus migulanus]|nr:hypothetical protein TS65_25420 [Aneurinibacillus migulanus]
MFCGPAWLGQKAALYASVRETNRRSFGARCGGYPFWIVLDNQHPCSNIAIKIIGAIVTIITTTGINQSAKYKVK